MASANIKQSFNMATEENDPVVEHIGWHDLDKRKFFTIGPTMMVGVRLVIFPPILIKTRLQVQAKQGLYNGTFDAFKKIYRFEGIRGFYKGFATSNLTIISGQIYISSFEFLRAHLTYKSETARSLIAGTIASLIGQTITVPIDIISQKQMIYGQNSTDKLKSNLKSKRAMSVFIEISKTSGLRGFYKGYTASILTFAPNSGIWWGSYYTFNQFYGSLRPAGTPDIVVQGLSGPSAAVVASFCTNPMDVIRTRLQVEGGKETMSSVFNTLYQQEGFLGFYKGLTARLTSSIPSGILLILTYEVIKKLSQKT